MKKSNQVMTFTALLLALPFSVSAESWSCRHDNNVREVHVVQETEAAVPCSVVYKKLTEGVEDQVLWTANSDANYCLEKAQGLVDKLTGWGWTCVETIADETAAETTVGAETLPVEAEAEATPETAPEAALEAEAAPDAAPEAMQQ
ncbi:MAG: hypothetical protein OQK98_00870 [Gammaproteobacteria bacterium]|nr:hypothetical protein [Gammaproteobacteria bacterium]